MPKSSMPNDCMPKDIMPNDCMPNDFMPFYCPATILSWKTLSAKPFGKYFSTVIQKV